MWLKLAQVEAEVESAEQLLMDERCRKRRPNAISARGGGIVGTRVLAKWVVRPKLTELVTKEVRAPEKSRRWVLLTCVFFVGAGACDAGDHSARTSGDAARARRDVCSLLVQFALSLSLLLSSSPLSLQGARSFRLAG